MQCADYRWSKGKPLALKGTAGPFFIIQDPYGKRISIERRTSQEPLEIVYDSALFDFRWLKQIEEQLWQRIPYGGRYAYIRSPEERTLLIEEMGHNEKGNPRCLWRSPHGILVARQEIYLTASEDPFNGVALYDNTDRPIWVKHYRLDPNGAFGELWIDGWDNPSEVLRNLSSAQTQTV